MGVAGALDASMVGPFTFSRDVNKTPGVYVTDLGDTLLWGRVNTEVRIKYDMTAGSFDVLSDGEEPIIRGKKFESPRDGDVALWYPAVTAYQYGDVECRITISGVDSGE